MLVKLVTSKYSLPMVVNEDSGYGTGQLPDKEADVPRYGGQPLSHPYG